VPVIGVGALIGAGTLAGFAALDSGPGGSWPLVALAAAYVAANLFYSFWMTLLRSIGRFSLEAGLQVGSGVTFLILGAVAAAVGWGLEGVMGVLLLREVFFAVLAFAMLRRDVPASRRHGRRDWRSLLRIGIKLAVASTALAVVTRSGLIILANAGTAKEVAWFSGPQRIADASWSSP
jgi:O-antigen/teichoic acid export membrane protein